MRELSQKALEEMDQGVPDKAVAVFFEKAQLNVEKSKEMGYRMYDPAVYVKMTQPGVTDSMSYRAQPADFEQFPAEYEHFQNHRQGGPNRSVSINIIPNMDITHIQELVDMGLSTVDRLAVVDVVPPHLEYARQSAITLQRVLQEQANEHQENQVEERPAPQVPPLGRQEHAGSLRGPIPEARRSHPDVEARKGQHQSGPIDNRQLNLAEEESARQESANLENWTPPAPPPPAAPIAYNTNNWKVDMEWKT